MIAFAIGSLGVLENTSKTSYSPKLQEAKTKKETVVML